MKPPRPPPTRMPKTIGKMKAAQPVAKPLKRPVTANAPKAISKNQAKRPAPAPQAGMQLQTADGLRKYLTAGERDAFLKAAERAERPVRTLCMALALAGCRLSEALALTADRVDLAAGVLVFKSLKKRLIGIFLNVPASLPCSWVASRGRCIPQERINIAILLGCQQ